MIAMTTQTTVVNVTNHTYFNLGDTDTIADHWVELPSKRYTGLSVSDKHLPVNEKNCAMLTQRWTKLLFQRGGLLACTELLLT